MSNGFHKVEREWELLQTEIEATSFKMWKEEFLAYKQSLLNPNLNTDDQLIYFWQGASKSVKHKWRSLAGTHLKQSTTDNAKIMTIPTAASSPLKATDSDLRANKLDLTAFMLWKKDFLKAKKDHLHKNQDTDKQLNSMWLNHVSKQEKLNWRSKAGGYLKVMKKTKENSPPSSLVARVEDKVPISKPDIKTVQGLAPISVSHSMVSPIILDDRDAKLDSVSLMLWKEEFFSQHHLDPNLFTEDQIKSSWNVISSRDKQIWRSKAGGYLKSLENMRRKVVVAVNPCEDMEIQVPVLAPQALIPASSAFVPAKPLPLMAIPPQRLFPMPSSLLPTPSSLLPVPFALLPVPGPSSLPGSPRRPMAGLIDDRQAKLDSISITLWKEDFLRKKGDLLNPNLGVDEQLDYIWRRFTEDERHKWRSAAGSHLIKIETKANMTRESSSSQIPIPKVYNHALVKKPSTRTSSCSSVRSSIPSGRTEKLKRSKDLDQITYKLWRDDFLDKNPDIQNGNRALTIEWKNLTHEEKHKWRSLGGVHLNEGTGPGPAPNDKKTRGSRPQIFTKNRRPVVSEIEKPQEKFKFPVDNSIGPFVPFLKLKPNSLGKSLCSFTALLIMKEDGTMYYEHPYKEELKAFKPDEFQMSEVKILSIPPKLEETPFALVQTHEEVFKMLEHLKSVTEIAVDVEHHDKRSFLGLTCLIQISTRTNDYIIDGLSPDLFKNLECLNFVFTNPKITKVLHGAQSDIEWLQRDFGIYVVGMFDTCIAGEFLHGRQKSLKFLLEEYADVTDVDKKYQLADWRVRPLSDEMIHYARTDTHYLLHVYDIMKNLVLKSGDLNSVYELSRDRCLIRYEKPTNDPTPSLEKMKTTLNERQCYAYTELFKWRDSVAREKDESTHYVLTNKALELLSQTLQNEEMLITEVLESGCNDTIQPIVRDNMNHVIGIITRALTIPLDEDENQKVLVQQSSVHKKWKRGKRGNGKSKLLNSWSAN